MKCVASHFVGGDVRGYFTNNFSKVEDDVIFEYHITVMDDEFNLGLLTIRTPEGVFETDFDK